jgi:hypothetical protein
MVQVALAVPGKEIITASQAALPQKCPNFLQDFLNLSSRSLVFQALVSKYIHRHTQAASREEYALGAQGSTQEFFGTMNSTSFSLIHQYWPWSR